MSNNDQIKKFLERTKKLTAYLKRLLEELSKADQATIHIAVFTTGRLINVFTSRFEFDSIIEYKRDNDLNPSLVHVVSTNFVEINRLKEIERDIIERMISVIDDRSMKARNGMLQ